jgi:N-acetyltransferase
MTDLRPPVALVGRIVRAEPLEERHRDDLRAAAQDDLEIFRFTNLGFIGFETWFDQALAATHEAPFAVVVDGVAVGSMRFLNDEPAHKRVEIGWSWLRTSAWGTGANAETKFLMLQHAFETHGYQRVEFKTDARNERARAGLASIGGQFEGIFRKHMILPSGVRSSAWYAIVDDDWPDVKAMLQERIARYP